MAGAGLAALGAQALQRRDRLLQRAGHPAPCLAVLRRLGQPALEGGLLRGIQRGGFLAHLPGDGGAQRRVLQGCIAHGA